MSACEHVWQFFCGFGEDVPGKSYDSIDTCTRCGVVRHDYRHNAGQTSPNYPVLRALGPGSNAQAILDLAEARLRDDRVTDVNVRHDFIEIARLARESLQ